MNTFTLFYKLISANVKRLKRYIPQLITSVILILAVCFSITFVITDKLFTEETFQVVKLAYYLPEDDDLKYNSLALGMIQDMESISEVATMTRVMSEEEGYRMLENGEILFFIIVPERFFTGIMDSTNPQLTIVIKNYDDISTYIANELLMSYARYLGVAQAGIYSALDTVREQENWTPELENIVLENTNVIYLERALNHGRYLETVDAKDAGDYTLIEHYIASAILLTLCFSGFILTAWIQGKGNGIKVQLNTRGISSVHIFFADFIACIEAVIIAYIPCLIGAVIYTKQFRPGGLLTVIPVLIVVALFISLISSCCNTCFTANITIFIVALVLVYIGGGILPSSFLPNIIRRISAFLPGEHLIKLLCRSLF